MMPLMLKDATVDSTQKYRYVLERQWGPNAANFVNFILLNPSTADSDKDDATVRACVEFARRWKFDKLIITNLFAFRATDPAKMKSYLNPVGDQNNVYIKYVAERAKKVVVAWGNHGTHFHRDKEVLNILRRIKKQYCLGITKFGHPKHPLYVKRDNRLKPFTN